MLFAGGEKRRGEVALAWFLIKAANQEAVINGLLPTLPDTHYDLTLHTAHTIPYTKVRTAY